MKYDAKFIQLDSVAGHLNVEDDVEFHDFIQKMRQQTNAFVLGGVRFKYQPLFIRKIFRRRLENRHERCDGIVSVMGTGPHGNGFG